MREAGRLHPRAAFVQANFEIRSQEQAYDLYGQPLKDPLAARAKLLVSRLSMRLGADIPFPGWNPSFFTDGASGKPGDRALVQDDTRAFWFNTRSAACWAQKTDVRDPSCIFFPAMAGRAEASFKPAARQAGGTIRLFAASHHNWTLKKFAPDKRDQGTRMVVDWSPEKGELTFLFRERPLSEPRTATVKADLPPGRWTRVAVAWTPKKSSMYESILHAAFLKRTCTRTNGSPSDAAKAFDWFSWPALPSVRTIVVMREAPSLRVFPMKNFSSPKYTNLVYRRESFKPRYIAGFIQAAQAVFKDYSENADEVIREAVQ